MLLSPTSATGFSPVSASVPAYNDAIAVGLVSLRRAGAEREFLSLSSMWSLASLPDKSSLFDDGRYSPIAR
uniref:Uncharacterized protein n=1 Tax=mine drainage metagenome TaxID=410659 RepID=E6QIM9_9ZZZZ